ncbi:hypothetical protein [Chitinimonas koreensis]|uniref:hypothetical protein n=1 Tax=Chitinimonas koreensis TaxID=356302 RepID=UPI0004215209|nr:hypothetical protein [Chitinimonas koreensis]QNM96394.1 hypothetical protein H9L41_21835 [Chitinimonas koreensis]
MSLESNIADLVSAANALTAEFNAKASSINTAVASAIAAIPVNVVSYYVDSVVGDDSATGALEAPLKTLKAAIDRTPTGGAATIYLNAGTTQRITAPVTIFNKYLYIGSYGAGDKPVLQSDALVQAGQNTAYGLTLRESTIAFTGLKLRTATLADGALPVAAAGLIQRADRAVGNIIVGSCDIELNAQHLAGTATSGGMLRMHFYSSAVTRPSTDGRLLALSGSVADVSINALTLPAGTVLADLFSGIVRDGSNVPRNFNSNIVL